MPSVESFECFNYINNYIIRVEVNMHYLSKLYRLNEILTNIIKCKYSLYIFYIATDDGRESSSSRLVKSEFHSSTAY